MPVHRAATARGGLENYELVSKQMPNTIRYKLSTPERFFKFSNLGTCHRVEYPDFRLNLDIFIYIRCFDHAVDFNQM